MEREMYGVKTQRRRREEAGANLVSLSVFLLICAAVVVHVSGDSTTVNYNTTQLMMAFTTNGPTPELYNPDLKNSLPIAPGSENPGGSTNQSLSSNSSSSVITTHSLPANDTPPTTGVQTTIPVATTPAIVVPPTTSLPTTTTRLPTTTTRLPTTTTRLPTTTTSIPTKGLQTKELPKKGLQAESFNATGPPTTTHQMTHPPSTHQNTTVPLGARDSNTTSLTSRKSTTTPATTAISQTPTAQENTTIPVLVLPTFKPATTAGLEHGTKTPQRTNHVNITETWNHGEVTVAGRTSGSSVTSSPATSIVFDTSIVYVTDNPPADITAGKETTPYVTQNVTPSVNGTGLNPDHEKDELKTLLLIVGGSIGAAVALIILVFIVVYRVAKKRSKDKNSRYYNFKKKASRPNYEKVLHLQEYCGELETDVSSPGTGAGWVFQENDQDAGKTITLELTPKDKNKPANRSGKSKSRNKNKNNINKSTSRGNYQVLAEIYPTRNIPPDVLLSADGAVNSNSEDEEGAVHETSFSAVTTPSDDKSDRGSVITDGLASINSFNDGVRPVWPTWNTSPYVKITQDDAVVEL